MRRYHKLTAALLAAWRNKNGVIHKIRSSISWYGFISRVNPQAECKRSANVEKFLIFDGAALNLLYFWVNTYLFVYFRVQQFIIIRVRAAFYACEEWEWDGAEGAPNGASNAEAVGSPFNLLILNGTQPKMPSGEAPPQSLAWSSAFRSAPAQVQSQQQQLSLVIVPPLESDARATNQRRAPSRGASAPVNARCALYAVRGARLTYVCYPQQATGQNAGRVYYLETGAGERLPSVVYASPGSNVLSATPVSITRPRPTVAPARTPRPQTNGGGQNPDAIVIPVDGWNSGDDTTTKPSSNGES